MKSTIKNTGLSPMVNMGPIALRQPIPTQNIDQIDPFVLLHHYGPYDISLEHNPFDLGPHPHRGFEPITFLIQGEQLHRDSLGNESVVEAGDVQWTTAGRGIVHAEAPTQDFVNKGGVLEGIQLWLNLPSNKKMIPANYQHIKSKDFNTEISSDKKIEVKIVAGSLNKINGKIGTQTPVNAFIIDAKQGGTHVLNLDSTHQSMLYLISGEVRVNNTIVSANKTQLIEFNNDGNCCSIDAIKTSKLLFLSGMPLKENVVSYGPYVMNTQTEIMEAMRDFKQGKMGFLPLR